jgi:hypothetical protein
MPWWNPFDNSQYRASRDQEIQSLGDEAYDWLYGDSRNKSQYEDLPEEAQRALWKFINGDWDQDHFYAALREARLADRIERICKQLAKGKP